MFQCSVLMCLRTVVDEPGEGGLRVDVPPSTKGFCQKIWPFLDKNTTFVGLYPPLQKKIRLVPPLQKFLRPPLLAEKWPRTFCCRETISYIISVKQCAWLSWILFGGNSNFRFIVVAVVVVTWKNSVGVFVLKILCPTSCPSASALKYSKCSTPIGQILNLRFFVQ